MHRALPAAFFEWLWLRRAAAFAKRLGSAARHLVAPERRSKAAGPPGHEGKLDRRCRRHRRSNYREPKVPLGLPRSRHAQNTVIYSVLAPEWAKTLPLDPLASCWILGPYFVKSRLKFG